MSSILRILTLSTLLLAAASLEAQPFYGYQTIGVHTWYVSVHWDGQQPHLGVGYGLRRPWGGFTEWTAELRSPLTALFDYDQQTFLVGSYGPLRLRSRPFLGGGVHLRLQNREVNAQRRSRLTLAGTLLPSYAMTAPLGDQPYLTAGLRATGLLVLLDQVKGGSDPDWFPAWGTELGAQASLHLERSAGLAFNAYAQRLWSRSDKSTAWTFQGDFYAGSTYYLRR